jgi:hypothetical protein
MKKIGAAILVTQLALALSVCAQSKFQLEAGGGYVVNFAGSALSSFYGNGWMIRLGADYQISPAFHVVGNLGYQQYSHLSDSRIVEPPRLAVFVGPQDVEPGNQNAAHVFEVSVAARLCHPGELMTPFISVGGGMFLGDYDRSERGYVVYGNSGSRVSFHNGSSGDANGDVFFAVGLGAVLPLTAKIDWVVEGRFITSYYGNDLLPLTASVRMGF